MKTINTMTQFNKQADSIEKKLRSSLEQFAEFAHASVLFYLQAGDRNIHIIQRVSDIAYDSRGVNHAQLNHWLSQLVPYKLEEEYNRAPKWGKRKGTNKNPKPFPTMDEVKDFLGKNPDFREWNREKLQKTAEFDHKKTGNSVLGSISRAITLAKGDNDQDAEKNKADIIILEKLRTQFRKDWGLDKAQ